MSGGHCTACGARMSGRFCGQCGRPVTGAPPAGRSASIWVPVAATCLSLVVLLAVLLTRPPAPPPGTAGALSSATPAAGTPPDISGLSPRQRFDTLYNVVMRASEAGDAARVTRFAPMAFMAYGQLEEVDDDARYHAAVLRMHVEGDIKPALLLADSIQANSPRHLFGYLIRGSAGQLTGDGPMTQRAAREFLSAWDAEIASGKPEYQDHRIMLDQFRTRALKATAEAPPRS